MFHDLYMKSVVAHIECHIAEKLDFESLARVAGYDGDYFRRIFKNTVGDSPARYVLVRKLSHAAFELKNSVKKISRIALDFGFSGHDSFSRAFRRYSGMAPSEFRMSDRTVKGVFITPGCMGPKIFTEEEKHMTDKNIQGDSNILYGVPKISYFNDPPEVTPFISSLRACLTYSGQEMPYSRLLSGSGAAFRLLWNEEFWDGGNVDIMAMREDAFEPVRRAFETAGRTFTLIEKNDNPGNRDEMITLIKEEIDAGRPVIAFGIIGPPEACVITGYTENGNVLLGWNFFQDFPEWKGSLKTDPCGYFIRQGWYEHSETRAVMAVGKQGPLQGERDFLKETLEFAAEVIKPGVVKDSSERSAVHKRASGLAAFDAWKRALTDESGFPKGAQLPLLMERLMCQEDAVTMIAEGRMYAGLFLEQEAQKFPEIKCRLLEIASLLKKEHETAWKMTSFHGGMGMGEKNALELAKPENRHNIAKLIDTCKDIDASVLQKITELIIKF